MRNCIHMRVFDANVIAIGYFWFQENVRKNKEEKNRAKIKS